MATDDLRAARGTRAMMKRNADKTASAVSASYLKLVGATATPDSIAAFVKAALPLVKAGESSANALVRTTYKSARRSAGLKAGFTLPAPPKFNSEQVESSLRYVGFVQPGGDDLGAGFVLPSPKQVAKQVGAAASRHVVQSGMDTAIRAVASDSKALGWARVTQGADACYFCSMLESRGIVYSKESFEDSDLRFSDNMMPPDLLSGELAAKVHDNCRCILVPVYSRGTILRNADKLYATWKKVQSEYGWLRQRQGWNMIQLWRAYWDGQLDKIAAG